MPIWGIGYIKQFIDFGLPTLIAPGNLPAVAKALPSTLVFLTGAEDAKILREHPAVRYLASICDVEIELIDDLITGDNYSTTITLAYARGVRAAGAAMQDTCFFFLISDYLMANGSLASVLARMKSGASGVLAGNFQVVEHEVLRTFYPQFDRGAPDLSIPPRELARWAFKHLHSMTAANMVDFPFCRSEHSNRLFWRVDENTLIGRFYLMHMICIRPEVEEFIVGSSCDYSFIPELCPSDNVEILTDSDDYLVVEMQPRHHEKKLLRAGAAQPTELALVLSEWATARHRKNARSTVVFHASNLPPSLPNIVAEADAFIEEVDSLITPEPQPHRDHPYWIGAIAAHEWACSLRDRAEGPVLGAVPEPLGGHRRVVQRARDFVFGRPPRVRPWHPRWPDYRTIINTFRNALPTTAGDLALLSATPAIFSGWITPLGKSSVNIETRRVVNFKSDEYIPLMGSYDGILLFMGENELEQARDYISRIIPLLKPSGALVIAIINGRGLGIEANFVADLMQNSSELLNLSTAMKEVWFVRSSKLRWTGISLITALYSGIQRRPFPYYVLAAIATGPLLLLCLLGNLFALRPRKRVSIEVVSSTVMVLRSIGKPSAPDFSVPLDLYANAERYEKALARLAKPASEAMRV